MKGLITALSKPDMYRYFGVTFCDDTNVNTVHLVIECTDDQAYHNFYSYLEESDFTIGYVEPQNQHDIEKSLDFCRSTPSTFYCCGVVFDDAFKKENRTRGYLFTNVEEGSEKYEFEKFLNKHLNDIDVI